MTWGHRDLVERDLEWVEWVEWYPPPSRTDTHGPCPFAPIVSAYGPWCLLLGSRGSGPAPRVRLYIQVEEEGGLARSVPGKEVNACRFSELYPDPLEPRLRVRYLSGGPV